MNIVLTGSAGLLGGALAQKLMDTGHNVLGLVHDRQDIRGNDNHSLDTRPYDGSMPAPPRIAILKGDVRKDNLGLKQEDLIKLQLQVDCVVHCAALVRFEADFEALKAVNVNGTTNLAAAFPNARFIHVSTAYSCGLTNGPIAEAPHVNIGSFANGYERSKALAEIELLKLRPDAVIVRPSIIVGERDSGRIRSFDTIYRAFKLIAEGRISILPVSNQATLNFVPIDHVVNGIISLATMPAATAGIVHLAASKAIMAVHFLKLIASVDGLQCPTIAPVQSAPPATNQAARAIAPYLSYFARWPDFDTALSEHLTGIASPEMNEEALLRQIQFCVDSGYIQPR